jgi:hypothetical protein
VTTALTTLAEVLGNDSRFDPSHFLYLPKNEGWRLETVCTVLDDSPLGDQVPSIAKKNGLSYALEMAAVHDLVANARAQIVDVRLDQLLLALQFYYDHDAFIILKE